MQAPQHLGEKVGWRFGDFVGDAGELDDRAAELFAVQRIIEPKLKRTPRPERYDVLPPLAPFED